MTETGLAQPKIAEFVHTLVATSGLDIGFAILACNLPVPAPAALPATSSPQAPGIAAVHPSTEASSSHPAISSAPLLAIEFTGPDAALLTQRNGELLLAFEHLTIQLLHLPPNQHERVSFDAQGFKAARHLQLQQQADAAIASVRSTGVPYAFEPMTSRERRLLHLALTTSGLPTASAGEGPRRHVVLYPEGYDAAAATPLRNAAPAPSSADRTRQLRNAFRRR